ncbi:MarR family winged helix-turn-helix transcriptional regulator [uncultured Microbacterium sp.]|uniref:MarR family winged helix-turn-helix transcriptional regulator n=1 Tax=uncultured Microbacterium sp. TaxID=191216 RepID=UPI0035CBEA2E
MHDSTPPSARPTPSTPPVNAAMTLVLLARSYEQRIEAELAPLSLSIRKLGVLASLKHRSEASFTSLADDAGISVQSMHVIVRALVADGYVVMSGGGRGRSARLRITDAGLRAIDDGVRTSQRFDAEWFDESDDPDTLRLGTALRAVGSKYFQERAAARRSAAARSGQRGADRDHHAEDQHRDQ